MKSLTLGRANSGPRIGPVEISELMYNPAGGNADLEFVELKNVTGQMISLSSTFAGVGTIPWKIEGIGFDFPLGASIAPYGALVVVRFDPNNPADAVKLADFRTTYNIGPEVQLIGTYSGLLDNTGEPIRLLRPDAPPADDPTAVPYLLVDEVIFESVPPWPTEPNSQNGTSLTRLQPSIYGDDANNWAAAVATPGTSSVTAPTIIAGDFNLNSALDENDIPAMLQALTDVAAYESAHSMSAADLAYVGDLTGDGTLRNSDIQSLLDLIITAQSHGAGAGASAAETISRQPAETTSRSTVLPMTRAIADIGKTQIVTPALTPPTSMLGAAMLDTPRVFCKSDQAISTATLTTPSPARQSNFVAPISYREPDRLVKAVDLIHGQTEFWRQPHVNWQPRGIRARMQHGLITLLDDELATDY